MSYYQVSYYPGGSVLEKDTLDFNLYLSDKLKPSAVMPFHALFGRGDMLEQVGQILGGDHLGVERLLQSRFLLLELPPHQLLGHDASAQSENPRHLGGNSMENIFA